MALWIGTSGWQYPHWDRLFYPEEVAKSDQLAWYAARYRTVEVNFTFYRLPEAPVFRKWAEETPEEFLFALKASRFLTHMKKLKDPEEPVTRLMDRASELGPKLGPVLLQLPPNLGCNVERLDRALALLKQRAPRVAVEFRHLSWNCEEVYDALARHDAALCLADRGSRWITPVRRTASWGYVRYHGGAAQPPGCYEEATLEAGARTVADLWGEGGEVYVYFNNDMHRCALRDADLFARDAARLGLAPTRTIPAGEIEVG